LLLLSHPFSDHIHPNLQITSLSHKHFPTSSSVNQLSLFHLRYSYWTLMLWQPLVTKTNDYTSGKSLNMNIKWEVYKRTQQGVSAKLESYIYRVHMVCATSSCLPHFLLKATMLYTYALISSSRFFYYVLGLWHHIMWHVMWLLCHVPSSSSKIKIKRKSI